jgi:hypothetical protein
MAGNEALKTAFSRELQDSLVRRYKRVPSAAFIAKEFNLRASASAPVTAEAARRWIKGFSIPEFDKLVVLRNWLSLDLNLICMQAGMPYGKTHTIQNRLPRAFEGGKFLEVALKIDNNLVLLLSELSKRNLP